MWNLNFFFLLHDQKTIMCKIRKILPRKPKKLFKKSNPFTEKFHCRFWWIKTCKKKVVEMSKFWDYPPPPQLWKFTIFFLMNPFLGRPFFGSRIKETLFYIKAKQLTPISLVFNWQVSMTCAPIKDLWYLNSNLISNWVCMSAIKF